MSKWVLSRWMCAAVIALALFAMLPRPVNAMHPWASHWRRMNSSIRQIPVRRLLSSIWITRFNIALADWRKPAMTKIKPYLFKTGARSTACPLVAGQITVCNANYGNTGWGGLAQIWWDGTGHSYYGRALQNDFYYSGSSVTTVANRQLVICQEIGHLLGLGHVNVNMNNKNVGSCMDYTNDANGGPGGGHPSDPSNEHPYAHDYALINTRHNHIGFIAPELPSRQVEPPRAMLAVVASNPLALSQLGALSYQGDGGHTERYDMTFAGGWGMATWAIRPVK
jgi:hypothetical protein